MHLKSSIPLAKTKALVKSLMNRTELLLHVTIAPHCRSLTSTPAGTPGPGAYHCESFCIQFFPLLLVCLQLFNCVSALCLLNVLSVKCFFFHVSGLQFVEIISVCLFAYASLKIGV